MTSSKSELFERLLGLYVKTRHVVIKGHGMFQCDEEATLALVADHEIKMRKEYRDAEPDEPTTLQQAANYCEEQRARLLETGWSEERGCDHSVTWSPPWASRLMSLPLRHAWAVQKELDARTPEPYASGEFIRLDEEEAKIVTQALAVLTRSEDGTWQQRERVTQLWARLREETGEPDAPTEPKDACDMCTNNKGYRPFWNADRKQWEIQAVDACYCLNKIWGRDDAAAIAFARDLENQVPRALEIAGWFKPDAETVEPDAPTEPTDAELRSTARLVYATNGVTICPEAPIRRGSKGKNAWVPAWVLVEGQ